MTWYHSLNGDTSELSLNPYIWQGLLCQVLARLTAGGTPHQTKPVLMHRLCLRLTASQ